MLFQFAKQEFQKSFGFEWDGKNTEPKDPELLQFKVPFSVLIDLEVDGTAPTKEAIERRVSLAAFGYAFSLQFLVTMTLTDLPERTDTSSPGAPNHRNRLYRVCVLAFSFVNLTLMSPCILAWEFDDLVERIQACSIQIAVDSNVIGVDNLWQIESIQSRRPIDPRKLDKWLKKYSTFVYTTGKKAAGNDKINRFIVYYLSVGFSYLIRRHSQSFSDFLWHTR